jgi:UDP-glucose 4-epimerase
MKVLVAGSQGNIGRWVVGRLVEAGHTVRSFDQRAQPAGKDWEHIPGDIREMAQVRRAVQGMDAVIHMAAIPFDIPGMREQVMDTNLRGTWNVLLACGEAGIHRLVNFSSINALGHADHSHNELYLPLDDDVPHHPIQTYPLSKHIGEEMCQAFCKLQEMTIVSLRPTMVVYPREVPNPWWRNMAEDRRAYFSSLDFWSYIDARDVSTAALLGLTAPLKGHEAFLLTADDCHGKMTSAALVEKYYQHLPWLKISLQEYLSEDPYRSLVDCSKAKRLLGWKPEFSARDPSSELDI